MVGCQDKEVNVERFMEDGVEVVVNHLEPYKIKGESNTLIIEKEFTIDTEKDEIAKIGITDMEDFDVDSEGSIYFFLSRGSDENLVYTFDKNANFVSTFGRRGQGPGEIQNPSYLSITKKDEIPIQDRYRSVLLIFDRKGNLIKEIKVTSLHPDGRGYFTFFPLENGNYLAKGMNLDLSTNHRSYLLYLVDSKFEKLKELDKFDFGLNIGVATKAEGIPRVYDSKVTNGMIYAGNEKRGYEILIYDLDGKLLRKVRKKYIPVDVPDEFKETLLGMRGIARFKDKIYFPDKMPPFHYFFLDDEGRLYVKTYEKGDKQGEYIHDIFDSNGVFIARKSMAGYGNWATPGIPLNRAKAKNHRLYCIREKESGFKELVVYKII
jgi:hypothetical protein